MAPSDSAWPSRASECAPRSVDWPAPAGRQGLIFTSRVAARASRAANRQMMGLPRFWLVCVVPLALADRCARVRTIDEQLVHKAAASLCAVIALPGSLTLNISTSGGLVARNYTKIIGLADEVTGAVAVARRQRSLVPGTIIRPPSRIAHGPRRRYSSVATPQGECTARADRSSADRDSIFMPIADDAGEGRARRHHRRAARDAAPAGLALFDCVASNGGRSRTRPTASPCARTSSSTATAILGGALHVRPPPRARLPTNWRGTPRRRRRRGGLAERAAEVAATQLDRRRGVHRRDLREQPGTSAGAERTAARTAKWKPIVTDAASPRSRRGLGQLVLAPIRSRPLHPSLRRRGRHARRPALLVGRDRRGGEFNSMIAASGERTSPS